MIVVNFFAAGLGPSPKTAYNPLEWSGLFSGAQEADAPWSVPEAFLCVLLTAETCDCERDRLEHEDLMALARGSRALNTLTMQELGSVNANVVARINARPKRALAEACAALPAEMAGSVLAHALDLILCDGELAPREAEFLNDLIIALKLDADTVKRISDVMVLKNQY